MPSNAPIDTVHVRVPAEGAPQMTASGEDEAKTALRSRVAELEAAEEARLQHAAATMATAQRRAAALPSRIAEWIAAHQAEVADPRTNARLQAAHFNAIADGVDPASDEYFERIEAAIAHHPPPHHPPVPEPKPVNGGAPGKVTPTPVKPPPQRRRRG